MINANIQQEPADSYNPELAGQLAAIGIVKGKAFKPDDRMKKILTDAAAVGNAAGRGSTGVPRISRLGLLPRLMWANMLWQGGANFETPPPMFTKEGFFKPLPPTGARTLELPDGVLLRLYARLAGHDHAASRRRLAIPHGLPGRGQERLDGGKTYKVTLPKGIPAALLVVHALRQPVALDAPDAAALSACRQPELSFARCRSECRRLHDDLFRSDPARGRQARQLDSDHARQGLVHAPAPLQPA